MSYNQTFISKLTYAAPSANHFARLITLKNNNEDQRLFEFLINPSEISFSYSGKYNPAITGSTSLPAQNYSHGEAGPIGISGLIMDTWGYRKSLRKPLNDLRKLTVPAEGSTVPTPFYFAFGTELLGPCVLLDVSYTVSLFLGGEPAYAVVDLSMLEIPDPDTKPKSGNSTNSNVLVKLSDRQKAEASKKANEWLRANLSKLPAGVKKIVQANRFKYRTSTSGEVEILNTEGKRIGVLGTWDGKVFKPKPTF